MTIHDFSIQKPVVSNGNEIEMLSLQMVEQECLQFEKYLELTDRQKEVVKRLIHTTTCFNEVISSIYFTNGVVTKIMSHLTNSATIITDTNMIKTGLNSYFTNKYSNNVVCHVSNDLIIKESKVTGLTRSTLAARLALKEYYNKPVILACGNAPTFLYSGIESLLRMDWDLSKVIIIGFPVGFINVVECKEYTRKFLEYFNMPGILLEGRYGGSSLVIAALHSIYRQITD